MPNRFLTLRCVCLFHCCAGSCFCNSMRQAPSRRLPAIPSQLHASPPPNTATVLQAYCLPIAATVLQAYYLPLTATVLQAYYFTTPSFEGLDRQPSQTLDMKSLRERVKGDPLDPTTGYQTGKVWYTGECFCCYWRGEEGGGGTNHPLALDPGWGRA
jgi:hypothetical protein